jgi:hypothetical protein
MSGRHRDDACYRGQWLERGARGSYPYCSTSFPTALPLGPAMNSHFRVAACITCLILAFALRVSAADTAQFALTIDAGEHARHSVPICIDISIPEALANATQAVLAFENGKVVPAQIAAPRLLAPQMKLDAGQVHRELHFILDHLDAGQSTHAKLRIVDSTTSSESADRFAWADTAGKHAELSFGSRPLLRYMYEPLDDSSPARREETYKVFHQVYDPSGQYLVTKGAGGAYTHHRGLFYGFNKISYGDGKVADTWHCTGDAHQSHDGFLATEAGPVLGRHRLKIGWHGVNKDVFATEEREMTVYRQPEADGKPASTLIEFASILRPTDSDVQLAGDPQHAGFQFRASNEVAAKTKEQTYYLRTDGIGKPGDYRNWGAQADQVNFPWKGMSFVVGDKRYTVANLDRPQNPKPSRFSERDYGRFGSYFEYQLTKDKPLELNYRIYLQPGEMTVEQIAALDADFVAPPKVSIKPIP